MVVDIIKGDIYVRGQKKKTRIDILYDSKLGEEQS